MAMLRKHFSDCSEFGKVWLVSQLNLFRYHFHLIQDLSLPIDIQLCVEDIRQIAIRVVLYNYLKIIIHQRKLKL
jgi:hypothetical protein